MPGKPGWSSTMGASIQMASLATLYPAASGLAIRRVQTTMLEPLEVRGSAREAFQSTEENLPTDETARGRMEALRMARVRDVKTRESYRAITERKNAEKRIAIASDKLGEFIDAELRAKKSALKFAESRAKGGRPDVKTQAMSEIRGKYPTVMPRGSAAP